MPTQTETTVLSEEEIAANERMFRTFGNAATMSAEQQQRALSTIRTLQAREKRLREALECVKNNTGDTEMRYIVRTALSETDHA